jgi:hypothetical protein
MTPPTSQTSHAVLLVVATGVGAAASSGAAAALPCRAAVTEPLAAGASGSSPSLPTACGINGGVGWSLMTLRIEAKIGMTSG